MLSAGFAAAFLLAMNGMAAEPFYGRAYNEHLGIRKPAQLGAPRFTREECEALPFAREGARAWDRALAGELAELEKSARRVPTDTPPGYDLVLPFRDDAQLRLLYALSLRRALPAPFCDRLLEAQASEEDFCASFGGVKRPLNATEWKLLQRGLLPSGLTAVRMFTNFYSWKIDSFLLDGDSGGNPEAVGRAVRALDTALAALPRYAGQTRAYLESTGLPLAPVGGEAKRIDSAELRPGQLLRAGSYLSVSRSPSWSREGYRLTVDNFFHDRGFGTKTFASGALKPLDEYVITARPGGNTRGRRTGEVSTVKEEQEVTFERGTCFRVLSREPVRVKETLAPRTKQEERFSYPAHRIRLREAECR